MLLYIGLCMEEKQNGNLQNNQAFELLKRILQLVFENEGLDISNIITRAPKLLFVAARLGNFEYLNLLLHYYPELIWKVDRDDRSIFHIAIENRHERIFSLLLRMEGVRGLVTTYVNISTGDNMLHLAAKYAPLANTPNTASVTSQAVTPNNVSVTLQVNTPDNMSVTPLQANTPDNVSVTAPQVNTRNNVSVTPQNKRNNVARAAFELQREILWYKVRKYLYIILHLFQII